MITPRILLLAQMKMDELFMEKPYDIYKNSDICKLCLFAKIINDLIEREKIIMGSVKNGE